MNIQPPVININGTSADELMRVHIEACEALRAAIKALQETTPHGRDFQTVTPVEYNAARHQYFERSKRLHEILDEVVAITTDIHGQRDARRPRRLDLGDHVK
jgi:hypothetical protein